MSDLARIIPVTISAQTTTPSRVGFGTPCVLSYHTVFSPERARVYSSVAAMITDGFSTTHPAVRAANALFAQNPSPDQIVVGRSENDEKMKVKITPNATMRPNFDYKVYHNGVEAKFTSDDVPSVAEICTGLAAAIAPAAWQADTLYAVGDHVTNDTGPVKIYICTVGGTSASSGGPTGTGSGIIDNTVTWNYVGPKSSITATDNTTDVDVEAVAVADAFTLYVDETAILDTNDITPDGSPGIVSDITAVRAVNDDWYGLNLTNQGKAVITAAAVHIETLKKVMIPCSLDSDILGSGSSDLASVLQTAGYDRTMLKYHKKANVQFPGAAWTGKGLPKDPGSITWSFKTLAGVDYMDLSDTQITNLENKDCNFYIRSAGVNITQNGITTSHEWFDVIRGIDFIEARLQENIFGRLANLDKIPYTDVGVGIVENEVWGVLRLGISMGILASDPEPTVTVPLVANVSSADKANRLLPDVKFEATLAGAIHKVVIQGTILV